MENRIVLEEEFDIGRLADLKGGGLLQSGVPVWWKHQGELLDLRDARRLADERERCLQKGDYAEVKFINRILCQSDFVEKRLKVYHYPELFQIEHTDICNSRCIMCNHYFTRNHGCTFMDMDVIRRLETYLPYATNIALNGIGEPLLHPQIMEIMSTYEKYGIRLTTNTNLSVMNPELAAIMHRTFSDVQISCDAADRETYESIRLGLKFDTFVKNARMLRAAGSTEICMATVVMRQNIMQLSDIVALAADLGCDKMVLLDLNTSELLENVHDSVRKIPHTAAYYIGKACETADRLGVQLHALEGIGTPDTGNREDEKELLACPFYPEPALAEKLYRLYEELGFDVPVFPAVDTDYCTASVYESEGYCEFIENRPFISASGEVFNCCTRRMHSMGNMMRTDFENIWNGPGYTRMRHIMNVGRLPKYCAGCTYLTSDLMVDRIRVSNMDRAFYENIYDKLRMDIIRENRGKRNENI